MALFRLPPRISSLRTKFSLLVFLSTLLTALVVTAISSRTIHGFLNERVQQQLPSLLQRTADKIDLWYQQRSHELRVFADSPTLVAGLLKQTKKKPDSRSGSDELKDFLYYLLENTPQYRTLFVMDQDRKLLAWSGKKLEVLSRNSVSVADLAGVVPGEFHVLNQGKMQVASVAIRDFKKLPLGILYAVLDSSELSALLTNHELGDSGILFLTDREGNYITGNREPQGKYTRQVHETEPGPALVAYRNSKGEDVVGTAVPVRKINGWLVIEEPYAAAFAPVSHTLWRMLAINLGIVMIFSFVAYRVAVSLSRPIDALSQGVRRISEGEKNVVIPESSLSDEIGMLTHAFNTMTERLDNNTIELEKLSTTDALTQLYNYRFFCDYVEREEKRIQRTGQSLALIMSDIDNFKEWNDHYGHTRGDEILRQIARVLKESVRESDLVARYGGDEFVVLAPGTNLEGALDLAEKLRSAVAEADIITGGKAKLRKLTISTGVSVYSTNFNTLFEDADRALYSAKNAGRNCVRAAGVKG